MIPLIFTMFLTWFGICLSSLSVFGHRKKPAFLRAFLYRQTQLTINIIFNCKFKQTIRVIGVNLHHVFSFPFEWFIVWFVFSSLFYVPPFSCPAPEKTALTGAASDWCFCVVRVCAACKPAYSGFVKTKIELFRLPQEKVSFFSRKKCTSISLNLYDIFRHFFRF